MRIRRTAKADANESVKRAEDLAARGRHEEALAELDRALEAHPGAPRLLREKRRTLMAMGELTAQLPILERLRALTGDPALDRIERLVRGRLRELDPSWLPPLPQPSVDLRPSSNTRVLYLLKESYPYLTNGYTMRSRYTLRALARSGIEPVVLTYYGFPQKDGVSSFSPVESVDGTPHHRLQADAEHLRKDWPPDEFLTQYARRAAAVVEGVRPAVLHARSGFRGYEVPLVALALGRRYRLPVIYEVSSFLESTWTADWERAEQGELYGLRKTQEERCMSEAAHVVTISQTMRTDIIARGIDPAHVSVVPNGVEPGEFLPREPDPDLIRSLGFEGRVVLGYVSNLSAREGVDLLIEATAALVSRGLPVACLVVGDGPKRSALDEQIRRAGIGAVARCMGAVPHERVGDYYAAIDVFVVPRKNERAARWVTPLKPLEAMAMGKPLLVSNLPALLEIADPERRGLAFAAEDPADLAARAEVLVRDAALRRSLGEAGRAWVSRERSWDANARRYREIYEAALSGRARA